MTHRALLGLATAACLSLAAPHPAPPQSLIIGVKAPFGLDPHLLFAGPAMAAAREAALRHAMREAIDQVPLAPLYNQVVMVGAKAAIAYTPRMDEQRVASHARPTGAMR